MPHQFYVWSNYPVDLLGTFGYVCGKLPLSYFWTRRERILVSLGVAKTSRHNQYNLTDRSQWRLYPIALGQPQWVPYKQGFLGDLVALRGHKHCRWFEHISHIHRTKRWQKNSDPTIKKWRFPRFPGTTHWKRSNLNTLMLNVGGKQAANAEAAFKKIETTILLETSITDGSHAIGNHTNRNQSCHSNMIALRVACSKWSHGNIYTQPQRKSNKEPQCQPFPPCW